MTGQQIKEPLLRLGIHPSSTILYGNEVVPLQFKRNKVIIDVIKQHQGKWSQTLNNRYIPKSKLLLVKIVRALAAKNNITIESIEIIELARTLQLRGYSTSTVKSYKSALTVFLEHFYPKPVTDITKKEIEDFILCLATQKRYSEAAIHSIVNAIKFYLEAVLKKPKTFYDLPRPKKLLILPKVLGETELSRLFNAVTYFKHKALLFTAYSAG